MAPNVSAASVYSKLFANRPETDPFKRPKTKIRKGKHFKKELKKQRQIKKRTRITNARHKNESVLFRNLKETYPGVANVGKLSSKATTVFDPEGQTIDREKVDKIIRKLMTKKDVLIEKLTPTKGKRNSDKLSAHLKKLTKERVVSIDGIGNLEPQNLVVEKSASKRKGNNDIVDSSLRSKSSQGKKRSVPTIPPSDIKAVKSSKETLNSTPRKVKISESSSESLGKTQFQWILGDTSLDTFFR